MSTEDPGPAKAEAPTDHRLGPLEFDRADLVYFAKCSCGHRFGPLATIPRVQAAFEHHRTVMDQQGPGRHDG
ncbi:MAG TPA: hypothetical protein VLV81_11945 [Acidimicrobiia bacterium]|nr:hypothetical protein [Acidimicrobiia bacterium]